MAAAVYRFGPFELRPADYELTREGERVKLNPKAFDVLRLLLERHGRLVEKDDLLKSVWPDAFVEEANLSVQVAAIRKVLGHLPDGREFIETVPRRGYRFAARVDTGGQISNFDTRAADPGPAGGQISNFHTGTDGNSRSDPRPRPHARLVVLPLTILRPDPETDFLAFSLPDAIAAGLAEVPWLQVRSPHAAHGRAGADDLAALAASTRCTHALTGTLIRFADVRVNLQLLALPDATVCWSQSTTASLDALLEVEQEATRRVCRALASGNLWLPGTPPQASAPRKAAYVFYLRANQLAYETSRWTEARDLYQEALHADPDHAAAWAGLARCIRVIGKFGGSPAETNTLLAEAEQAFQRALALEPDLSVAHNLYAQLEVDLGRAPDAAQRLLANVRRRPVDPQLYAGLVHALRFCGLLDASLAAHMRARELDPTVPTSVHHTWWMLGEFERALGETFGDIGYMPGLALASLGREAEAVAALRWRERETGETSVRLLLTSLRALLEGEREESRAALDRVIGGRLDGEALYYLARSYARLGDTAQALTLLERSVAGGFSCHQVFTSDLWLTPLASHERFAAAVARAREVSAAARHAYENAGGRLLVG